MKRWIKYFLIALLLPLSLLAKEDVSYTVEFEGLDDPLVLNAIKSISQLTTFKKAPPSITALRHRAEADVPEILKVLRAFGYYEPKINFCIEDNIPKARVLIFISTGPLYRIQSFILDFSSPEALAEQLCHKLELPRLGIQLGMPAKSKTIIDATSKLLTQLSENGYPLATLKDREITVDGKTHLVDVRLKVQTGPLCFFGPLEILGAKDVQEKWIRRKITWQEGSLYDSRKLQETQKKLIETGLFSGVIITPNGDCNDQGLLPLKMELAETLHRSVSGGFSYQTKFGMGLTFGWENRNVNGKGEILSIQGDITRLTHSGIIAYRIPEFKRPQQDLSTEIQALYEDIQYVYSQKAYSLTSRLERKIGQHLRFSVGGRFDRMYVTHSLDNGQFTLLQMPLYAGWADVNNILNPTSGISLDYELSPTINFNERQQIYLEQRFSQGSYFPLIKTRELLTLAQKITFASILSPQLNDIPIPERILGGTEDDLRGYGYLTVSPLRHNSDGKLRPVGGRSAIFYTFETRFRVTESLGFVPFFDLGNVWLNVLPTFHGKWRKSVGLGLRYFTFIGPLRCDIGFPLDRRPELDNWWRIFVSIGQSF
ncbi:MAG: BamA/TamA family outer membrane protein [Simkania sp.]|nr:BamA/TamA family outer membrane protein [Simkania sp.]